MCSEIIFRRCLVPTRLWFRRPGSFSNKRNCYCFPSLPIIFCQVISQSDYGTIIVPSYATLAVFSVTKTLKLLPDSREKIVSRTTTARSEMQIFLYNLSFQSEYSYLRPSSLAKASFSSSSILQGLPCSCSSIITISRSMSTTKSRFLKQFVFPMFPFCVYSQSLSCQFMRTS